MVGKRPSRLKVGLGAVISALALQSGAAWAQENDEELDTDHLFAYSQGTDVGPVGTREAEGDADGRSGKRRGKYAVYAQEFEIGYVPLAVHCGEHAIEPSNDRENRFDPA